MCESRTAINPLELLVAMIQQLFAAARAATPRHAFATRAAVLMLTPDDDENYRQRKTASDPVALAIDVIIRIVSIWFLPLIVIVGLSLRAALGGTFPVRLGAPADPLDFPVPSEQPRSYSAFWRDPLLLASAAYDDAVFPSPSLWEGRFSHTTVPARRPLLLLANAARDPVLEDLRDPTSAARSLSLPRSEQRREEALQTLEDERLDRCRTQSPFLFDQCFL